MTRDEIKKRIDSAITPGVFHMVEPGALADLLFEIQENSSERDPSRLQSKAVVVTLDANGGRHIHEFLVPGAAEEFVAAINEEREACAKIADERILRLIGNEAQNATAKEIAAAIRARYDRYK